MPKDQLVPEQQSSLLKKLQNANPSASSLSALLAADTEDCDEENCDEENLQTKEQSSVAADTEDADIDLSALLEAGADDSDSDLSALDMADTEDSKIPLSTTFENISLAISGKPRSCSTNIDIVGASYRVTKSASAPNKESHLSETYRAFISGRRVDPFEKKPTNEHYKDTDYLRDDEVRVGRK